MIMRPKNRLTYFFAERVPSMSDERINSNFVILMDDSRPGRAFRFSMFCTILCLLLILVVGMYCLYQARLHRTSSDQPACICREHRCVCSIPLCPPYPQCRIRAAQ